MSECDEVESVNMSASGRLAAIQFERDPPLVCLIVRSVWFLFGMACGAALVVCVRL